MENVKSNGERNRGADLAAEYSNLTLRENCEEKNDIKPIHYSITCA